MKVTPFTRDLLKAYREEKANNVISVESIQQAMSILASNEPEPGQKQVAVYPARLAPSLGYPNAKAGDEIESGNLLLIFTE